MDFDKEFVTISGKEIYIKDIGTNFHISLWIGKGDSLPENKQPSLNDYTHYGVLVCDY